MKAYALSFFNKFLKNQDDHLLDGPSVDYPLVINFQAKWSCGAATDAPQILKDGHCYQNGL